MDNTPRTRTRTRFLAWALAAVLLAALLTAAPTIGVLSILFSRTDPAATGGACGPSIQMQTGAVQLPAWWDKNGQGGERMANTATIIQTGRSLGISDKGLVIAIATALQESGLVNIDYGDRDSVGLFQQRPSQGWGTPAQIMDPTYSATAFFQSLSEVPGWEQMAVTVAAQKVQRSGFPDAYADWETLATGLVGAAHGGTLTLPGACVPTGAIDPNCPGGDISGYPNGQIPPALLCPLYQADGHLLRADAANAFNQMSQAYQAHFGAPICVTDSYRTYATQVSLKARKPHLAARPGTSNHGLARAVDLCGGAQNFGTAQHEWLRANARAYGWCDPPWARRGGSKPEAWHWEYGNTKC